MPNLEWILFSEVKYETLSIPIPILEGCLYLLDRNSGISYGMPKAKHPKIYRYFHSNTCLCYVPSNSACVCLLLKVVGVKKHKSCVLHGKYITLPAKKGDSYEVWQNLWNGLWNFLRIAVTTMLKLLLDIPFHCSGIYPLTWLVIGSR